MSSTGSGYDLSVSTYSPDGRMFQVEYAEKAIENSGTALGVRCKDGVILGVEKLLIAKMLVPGDGRRIQAIDTHIGAATAGLMPDGRQLISRARGEAKAYRSNFGESITPHVLAERMGSFVHLFTVYWYLRPFGSSLLLAGYDKENKRHDLYSIEPTGNVMRYFGTAVGKGARAAKTEIDKLNFGERTVEESIDLVAKILLRSRDASKDKPMEAEISYLSESSDWKHVLLSRDRVEAALERAQAEIDAEEAGEDEDEDM